MDHLYAFATQYTRQMMDPDHKGSPIASLKNGKPYRTAAMKTEAKRKAYTAKDGSFYSPVHTRLHTEACAPHKCICR